jgi:pyochelin biosynthesis protein PchC
MSTSTGGLWLRRFHPALPGAPRLVCFPHAGGSASFFHPLSAALAPAVEVLAAQYPGRQDRRAEPVLTHIGALADRLADDLAGRPAVPTTFFGHSMGSLVGYEAARRLERRGTVLTRLYVSGRRPPDRPGPGDTVHTRDDDGVLAEVRALGGPGVAMLDDPELRELAMPAIRGDYTAIETYVRAPGPPLTCALTALVGDRDPQVTVAEARGWAGHTAGPFDLRVFPGGHFYVTVHADAVRAVLLETLAG